jgi:hypothetical protein
MSSARCVSTGTCWGWTPGTTTRSSCRVRGSLLQWLEPQLPAPPGERKRLGIGDVVFVMQSDDLLAVHRRLLDWGARIFAAPHEFTVRGADGAVVTMTSISFWDPDGYFFELNQRHAPGAAA